MELRLKSLKMRKLLSMPNPVPMAVLQRRGLLGANKATSGLPLKAVGSHVGFHRLMFDLSL